MKTRSICLGYRPPRSCCRDGQRTRRRAAERTRADARIQLHALTEDEQRALSALLKRAVASVVGESAVYERE
jgi:hypothetical protein